MTNEILALTLPQIEDDIDIFESVKALLKTHKFVYLDMVPEFNMESITYRFQRLDE